MRVPCTRRTGLSLLELLVVSFIVAIALGVLLAGVQSVRASARRAEKMNAVRQLLLSTRQFADSRHGAVPDPEGGKTNPGLSVPATLWKQMGGDPFAPPPFLAETVDLSGPGLPRPPQSPPNAEPVGEFVERRCGYAFNALVYKKQFRLDTSPADGLSGVMAITEHMAACGKGQFGYDMTRGALYLNGTLATNRPRRGTSVTTFADHPTFEDVHPVTTTRDGVPVTVGSLPLTFQVRPAVADCDPRIPNSSLPGGILAGMLDGSAKFVRPGVSAEVFWGSVTPAGGEAVSLD